MAKTTQVLKMNVCGRKFTVVYNENKINPFWVYRYTWGVDKYGHWRERKNIEVKYADMRSCMFYLATQI